MLDEGFTDHRPTWLYLPIMPSIKQQHINNWDQYHYAEYLVLQLRAAVRDEVVGSHLLHDAIEFIDLAIKRWLSSTPPLPEPST
jgi:hypothetical protein